MEPHTLSSFTRLSALKPEEVNRPSPAAIEWCHPSLRYDKQTPEKLSEAGLYYYGQSDQVKCFYCDGGLSEWQEGDDPWEEHAGWFSGCAFVRLIKGDAYVERSKRNVRMVVVSQKILTQFSILFNFTI